MSDTEIAGVAPTLMRLTVVTATGRYLRSFSTTGLGGRAVGPLGGGRIAAGGIAIGAERPELLAVFDRQGNRTRMRLRGPRLLQEYPLPVDATILESSPDSGVLLANSAWPGIWLIRGTATTELPLDLPPDVWVQLRPPAEPLRSFAGEELRRWMWEASLLTAAGWVGDSVIGVAWRTGQADPPSAYIALVHLRDGGRLFCRSPTRPRRASRPAGRRRDAPAPAPGAPRR